MPLMFVNHFRCVDLCSRDLCSRITSGVSQGVWGGGKILLPSGGVSLVFSLILEGAQLKKRRDGIRKQKTSVRFTNTAFLRSFLVNYTTLLGGCSLGFLSKWQVVNDSESSLFLVDISFILWPRTLLATNETPGCDIRSGDVLVKVPQCHCQRKRF